MRASRARIVQAGDDARRRLERNQHDGAQQRLVALSLSLRLAQSKVASDPVAAEQVQEAARDELLAALDELRELARGIHPAVLTDRGLSAAVEALTLRSPVPVEFGHPTSRCRAPSRRLPSTSSPSRSRDVHRGARRQTEEPEAGLEPTAYALQVRCSTS